MPLNPHEQELLAAIEKDLTEHDPRLARVIARSARWSSGLPSSPLRRRHLVTLASALFVLILVHTLFAEIHPTASAALTCALVMMWLVSVARPGTRTTSKRRKQRREEN
jgi:hypothetical protein